MTLGSWIMPFFNNFHPFLFWSTDLHIGTNNGTHSMLSELISNGGSISPCYPHCEPHSPCHCRACSGNSGENVSSAGSHARQGILRDCSAEECYHHCKPNSSQHFQQGQHSPYCWLCKTCSQRCYPHYDPCNRGSSQGLAAAGLRETDALLWLWAPLLTKLPATGEHMATYLIN